MSISPPRPRTPPLNALRAFEAAARLGGFSAAAGELNVSAGAVAQHVKSLEAWLDADLFYRRSQGVELTDLAKRSLEEFTKAFDELSQASVNLRQRAAPSEINIAALPSLAQLWVSPRLPVLRRMFPDCLFSLTALEARPNLNREDYDMAIFQAREAEVEVGDAILVYVALLPVAAPEIAERIHSTSDLEGQLLMKDSSWSDYWDNWAAAKRVVLPDNYKSTSFSLYSLAVDEARRGAGVLMGHLALVQPYIDAGELIPLLGAPISLPYVIVASVPSKSPRPEVRDVLRALNSV